MIKFKKRKTWMKMVDKETGNEERIPYENKEKLYPLILFVTIVNRDQSNYFTKAYSDCGASLSLTLYSYSMPPIEIQNLLGPDNLKKDIVFTIARGEYLPELEKIASDRFSISQESKGIAFACPIDSVSGISVYKFLADQNKELRMGEEENVREQQQHEGS